MSNDAMTSRNHCPRIASSKLRTGARVIGALVLLLTPGVAVTACGDSSSGGAAGSPSASAPAPSDAGGASAAEPSGGASMAAPTGPGPGSAMPTGSDAAFPAPDGATSPHYFISADGNVACTFSQIHSPQGSYLCQVAPGVTASWSPETPLPAPTGDGACDPKWQPIFYAESDGAGMQCHGGDQAINATTIGSGESVVNGNSACTVHDGAVTCWDTVTGNSFALSPMGYQFGNQGAISPDAFTW